MFSLKLENENGNIVDINDNVNYVVLSASGLTPPSASIFTTKSPNRKGGRYNGSALNERSIVLQIKILGDVEMNRNALYDWTYTEQYVKVHYQNGIRNVYCEGHIEDHDNDFFTDNQVVSLAILCENPYWKDLQEITYEITNILSQFTFPFAISKAGVPLSTIRNTNTAFIFNEGAETGIRIMLRIKRAVKNITVYDASDSARRLTINKLFNEGEFIVIDTTASPKTVKVHKADGTTENLMRYIAPSPVWLTLRKGNNSFAFTAEVGRENIEASVSFTNNYLGV